MDLAAKWTAHMRGRGLSERTIERRVSTLGRFGGHVDPIGASGTDIEDWLFALPVKPVSRAYYLADLKAFYKWAIRRDLVIVSPTDRVESIKRPKTKPRPSTSADLQQALETAPPRTRRMIMLAAYAGLRRAEIAGLRMEDIDLIGGYMVVAGKGDKERVVPINTRLRAELERGPRRGPVVRNHMTGGALTPNMVGRAISDHLRSLGIDNTAHQLRHWFGTHTHAQSNNLLVVGEMMGHSSTETTKGYVAFSSAAAIAAVEYLPRLLEQQTLPFN